MELGNKADFQPDKFNKAVLNNDEVSRVDEKGKLVVQVVVTNNGFCRGNPTVDVYNASNEIQKKTSQSRYNQS